MFDQASTVDGRLATPKLGATTTPWVLDLIRRFQAAAPTLRDCEHLAGDPGDAAVWQASIPDLRSCRRAACQTVVAAELAARLGHPLRDEPARCTTCGRTGVAVRGVGVAVGSTMLRGTVCDDCLAAKPVPTPTAVTDPSAAAVRRTIDLEDEDEPLSVDRETLAEAEDQVPFDELGRRAVRRGVLMAEACCRATTAALHRDQAVVGGLMVRAAKLARGLYVAMPNDGSLLQDLGFRALEETTAALRRSLLAAGDDAIAAAGTLAAFRDAGSAAAAPAATRHEGSALPVQRAPDAPPLDGSWRELTALHLSPGPDGFALDLGQPGIGPMRALAAGQELALACADYVDRMPTDLDQDHVRWLADEITELRAIVEPAFARAMAAELGDRE